MQNPEPSQIGNSQNTGTNGVHERDESGRTRLHRAALLGNLEEVNTLLWMNGAVDDLGKTALHYAAQGGHVQVCASLIAAEGVDVNAKDNALRTPLHEASERDSAPLVRLLLQNGADTTLRDCAGKTPLHSSAASGHFEICTSILEAEGTYVNARDYGLKSPLHLACAFGHEQVVKRLLEKGADVALQDGDDGWTPLHYAAWNGHHLVCAILLAKDNTDVNASDSDQCTPLLMASRNGHLEIVKLLLEKVTDAAQPNKWGETPLHMAAWNGHDLVCAILGDRSDLNGRNKNLWTPLHCASFEGHIEVVKALIQKGADATLEDQEGDTPLHLAARNGHDLVCARLMECQGVDFNARNRHLRTPLHCASSCGQVEVVKVLLERGADAKLRDRDDNLAMHCAVNNIDNDSNGWHSFLSSYSEEVVQILLQRDVTGN
ncbi:hypothetical protein C0J52_10668 [Blattella germanica]|nr:hypothetical protein C0J52_10668 [Blattella germanica]